jgi:hypothetical protein
VHLKEFGGIVKVFRTVSRDGDVEYWATDDLDMSEEKAEALTNAGCGIEVYHREGHQAVLRRRKGSGQEG